MEKGVSHQEFNELKELFLQQQQTIDELRCEADFFKRGLRSFIDEQLEHKGAKTMDFQMYKRFMTAQMGIVLTEIKDCFTKNSIPISSINTADNQWKTKIESYIRNVEVNLLKEVNVAINTKTDYTLLSEPLRKLQVDMAQIKQEWIMKDTIFELNQQKYLEAIDEKISELKSNLTNTEEFLRIKSTVERMEKVTEQSMIDIKRAVEKIQVVEKSLQHKFSDSNLRHSIQQELKPIFDLLKNEQMKDILHYKEKIGMTCETKINEITSAMRTELNKNIDEIIKKIQLNLQDQRVSEEKLQKEIHEHSQSLRLMKETIQTIENIQGQTTLRIDENARKTENIQGQTTIRIDEHIRKTENKLHQQNTINETVTTSIDKIQQVLEEIKPELKELDTKYSETKQNIENAVSDFLTQTLEIKREQTTINETIKTNIDKIQKNIQEIKPELKELDTKYNEIKQNIANAVSDFLTQTLEIKREQTTINETIKTNIDKIQKNIQEIKPELKELDTKYSETKQNIANAVSDFLTQTLEIKREQVKIEKRIIDDFHEKISGTMGQQKNDITIIMEENQKLIKDTENKQTEFLKSISKQFNEQTLISMRRAIEKNIDEKIQIFKQETNESNQNVVRDVHNLLDDYTKLKSKLFSDIDKGVQMSKEIETTVIEEIVKIKNSEEKFKEALMLELDEKNVENKNEVMKSLDSISQEYKAIQSDYHFLKVSLTKQFNKETFQQTYKTIEDRIDTKLQMFEKVGDIIQENGRRLLLDQTNFEIKLKNSGKKFQETLMLQLDEKYVENKNEVMKLLDSISQEYKAIQSDYHFLKVSLTKQFNKETFQQTYKTIEDKIDTKLQMFEKVGDIIQENGRRLLLDQKNFEIKIKDNIEENLKINKEEINDKLRSFSEMLTITNRPTVTEYPFINNEKLKPELKKCFFTAHIGNPGQSLDDIVHFKNVPGWDYIMFTNRDFSKKIPWTIHKVEQKHKDPAVDAKMYKWQSHNFLQEYDLVVWVDSYMSPNITTIKNLESLIKIKLYNENNGIIHRPHKERVCIWDECDAVVKNRRATKEDVEKNRALLKKVNMPRSFGLFDTNIVCRLNKDPEVHKICDKIYETIQIASSRDQLAVPMVYYTESFNRVSSIELLPYFVKSGTHVRIPAFL